MKRFTHYFLLLLPAVAFVACGPDPVYPAGPQLTFKEYRYNNNDSLKVMFTFTDGDGDIGVAPTGSDPNMVLTLYYKGTDGNFHVARPVTDPADSISYPYRITQLPRGQNGLSGEIHVDVSTQFMLYDTIQFNAFLLDQTQHKSAVIRTPEIVLQ